MKPNARELIHTALITALTIAIALIWKDVFTEAVELFIPARDELFYKFLAAVVATLFTILGIFLITKTESEADSMMEEMEHMREHFRKKKNNAQTPPPPIQSDQK